MNKNLERKLTSLRKRIRKLDSALVAFSGGVDSSFLMRICREELGDKAVAVTALSDDYPRSELSIARRVAKIVGANHLVFDPSESAEQRSSGVCRGANIYSCLKSLAMRMKVKHVLDGSHLDDKVEHGDSFNAARNAGIQSPLLESDLSKAEIRLLAKEFGLPNWDKPSSAERKKPPVVQHAAAAKYLRTLKSKARLIVKGEKAVVVASKNAMVDLASKFGSIEKKLKSFGFTDVSLKLG